MIWLVGLPQRPLRCVINEGLGLFLKKADLIGNWEGSFGSFQSLLKGKKGSQHG